MRIYTVNTVLSLPMPTASFLEVFGMHNNFASASLSIQTLHRKLVLGRNLPRLYL